MEGIYGAVSTVAALTEAVEEELAPLPTRLVAITLASTSAP